MQGWTLYLNWMEKKGITDKEYTIDIDVFK